MIQLLYKYLNEFNIGYPNDEVIEYRIVSDNIIHVTTKRTSHINGFYVDNHQVGDWVSKLRNEKIDSLYE